MRMPLSSHLREATMLLAVLTATASLAGDTKPNMPALEDAIRLADQTLPTEKAVESSLPPLPARPGRTVVLRLRLVSYANTEAGCN